MKPKVYGVGTNDTIGTVTYCCDGKRVIKPIYRCWSHMLERCYSKKYQRRFPAYKGCIVNPVWHHFSAFKLWCDDYYIRGYQLDKDILVPHNKVYSSTTCCFIPRDLNMLLNNCRKRRNNLPGVYYYTRFGCFKSQISIGGKNQHLGYFNTAKEAHQVYLKAKNAYVKQHAQEETRPRIKTALLRLAQEYI